MSNSKTQEERLDYLVEEFKADSDEYKDLQTSKSVEEKRRILRSLMNIRMPKELSSEVLKVQDEYLTERAAEIAVDTVKAWLAETGSQMKVVFNVYKDYFFLNS